MKKSITIMLIALIAIVGSVFAYQGTEMGNPIYEKGAFHEEVESVIETGNYGDLVNLREKLGFNVMRKVQSEKDFNEMKQRYEFNEANGIEPRYLRNKGQKGSGMNQGFGKGQGMINNGNCPYIN